MILVDRMMQLIEARQPDIEQLVGDDEALVELMLASLEQLVSWRVPTPRQPGQGEAVVAFSFGRGARGTPGRTNRALAALTRRICQFRRVPVFAQWEIADVLVGLGEAVAYTAVPTTTYLSTKGVWAQFQHAWAQQNRTFNTIILVAHPDHQYRCYTLLSQAGYTVLVSEVDKFLPEGWVAYGCDPHGYDPNSIQPWTRNRRAFIRYEIGVRLKNEP